MMVTNDCGFDIRYAWQIGSEGGEKAQKKIWGEVVGVLEAKYPGTMQSITEQIAGNEKSTGNEKSAVNEKSGIL